MKNKGRVLVVGDMMLDETILCRSVRKSEESPPGRVPIAEPYRTFDRLGGAGNVAANVDSLGGWCHLVSLAGGHSQYRDRMLKLVPPTIQTSLVVDHRVGTTVKTRLWVNGRPIARVDRNAYQNDVVPVGQRGAIESSSLESLESVSCCLVSDYGKGVVTDRLAAGLMSACRDRQIVSIVDPYGTNFERYRGAVVLKLNRKQLESWWGSPIRTMSSLRHAGENLIGIMPGTMLVITLGRYGAVVMPSRTCVMPLPISGTSKRKAVDVTGAGDVMAAGMAVRISQGATLLESVLFGQSAARRSVERLGTVAVSRHDVEEAGR